MAQRVLARSGSSPGKSRRRRRVAAGDGTYFAGEVVRILNLRHLDYDQLHRLYDIVRGHGRPRGERETWRRFTFTDLASIKVAAELIGVGSKRTQRLRLKQLEEVCRHLKEDFGLQEPLIHAQLRAVGSTIVVQLEGKHFSSTTTQRVFDALAVDLNAYNSEVGNRGEPQPRRRGFAGKAQVGVYQAPVLSVGRIRR